MIALPFPQRDAVPMVLSARFVAPLGPNGYDFGALDPVQLVNVSSGYLYRILAYSFAVEVPEGSYQGAQQVAYPVAFQLRTTGNETDVLAKPIPVPIYQRDAKILQYFRVPDDATNLQARLSGRLSGGTVDLIGYAEISAVLSLTVQALGCSEWQARFEAGEM